MERKPGREADVVLAWGHTPLHNGLRHIDLKVPSGYNAFAEKACC